ncbi:hypothetical protein GGI04_002178 [Coemansia thaxteri]|nr:hypothetical protein GGI04_002178 [Coemansia thaxteri]
MDPAADADAEAAPAPLFALDLSAVCDVERRACHEFFAGKANKTPERYMAIRNYMVQAWQSTQPQYLTKIRARAGLRNCGDVNAIGRVHTFLEGARVINVGAVARVHRQRPAPSATSASRRRRRLALGSGSSSEGEDEDEEEEELPVRRRRVRGGDGGWVYEDEHPGGHVIAHSVVERHADDAAYSVSDGGGSSGSDGGGKRRGKRRRRRGEARAAAYQAPSEFRLVPCCVFGAARQQPFAVQMTAAALALMDLHAHLMDTEVIGLLGGAYDASARVVRVDVAFPCNSTSTTTECEMDPASEVDARRVFARAARHVVGWFHSHPTFDAMPSVRDIHNQHAYQALCRRAADSVEPFVGAIVSPPAYEATAADYGVSDIRVFYAVESASASASGSRQQQPHAHGEEGPVVPYHLPYAVIARDVIPPGLISDMVRLIERHSASQHRADLARRFRRSEAMTVLEKLIISLRSHWDDAVRQQWDDAVSFRLRPLLQRHFCRGKRQPSHLGPAAPAPAEGALHEVADDLPLSADDGGDSSVDDVVAPDHRQPAARQASLDPPQQAPHNNAASQNVQA